MNDETLYRVGRTRYFTQIFETADSFRDFYLNCGIPPLFQKEDTIDTLYYLICAYYANSRIISSDENRFKYNVMSIVFQYGPTWEKKLEIQDFLRKIDIESNEWLDSSKSVNNVALNPATDPEQDVFSTIETINQQTTNINRRGKLNGIAILMEILKNDVTGEFLQKFKRLFRTITYTSRPLLYETEEEQ